MNLNTSIHCSATRPDVTYGGTDDKMLFNIAVSTAERRMSEWRIERDLKRKQSWVKVPSLYPGSGTATPRTGDALE
jgi:hypothetical protein